MDEKLGRKISAKFTDNLKLLVKKLKNEMGGGINEIKNNESNNEVRNKES